MRAENWLPRGFVLPNDSKIGKKLYADKNWQLYVTGNKGYSLAISQQLYAFWKEFDILPAGLFKEINLGNSVIFVSVCEPPSIIGSVRFGPFPESYEDAVNFAKALRMSRAKIQNYDFSNGLYFEKNSIILPDVNAFNQSDAQDQAALCRWLSSGVELSLDKFDRLCEIATWLPSSKLSDIIAEAGYCIPDDVVIRIEKHIPEEKMTQGKQASPNRVKTQTGDHFELPGRPALEAFFNDHVVDIIKNAEKYRIMGIDFPSAIILHGPPGCGKTYAVERLVEFLGWPSFNVDSGSIGSPYIHDTSKKISEVFDVAIKQAPSVIIIDEMEAFLSSREGASMAGQHHVEEVAEFLRRIPEAASKHVLIVAMTNLIDTIDPAILRRGRFDHIIEVAMPTKEEVNSLLHHLTKNLPISDDFDFDIISTKLQGHAMSDVTFVIKEAGRLAVRADQNFISNELINDAINQLPRKEKETRKIGF